MFKALENHFVSFLLIVALLTLATLTATTAAPAPTAHAAVPHYLGYEGYLTDTSDNAITNSYNLTFRIYDALTAGSLLWTETHSAVTVTNGYFSVQLGSITALNLNFDIPYWISFQVESDTEMTPRQPVNSVGFSYFSDNTYALTDADLDTTIDADTNDQIDIAIAGADDFQFVANILKLLTGSSMETDTISETTATAGVTIDSITLKDGGSTVITGGTNTFNITNGSSSLDVAAGSALDVNANLTVESASFINQDLTTDASVAFTGLSNTDANITAVGDIALDSISSAGSHISIAAADSTDMLQIGDGTYSWGFAPMVGIEGILEVNGVAYFDSEANFTNNAASATFGAVGTDADVVLAFDAVTAQGSITYMEDEDRFDFDNDVDVIGDLTAATITSDDHVTATGDVSVGDDVLLADGAVIGITGNEIMTFAEAGTITFSGAEVHFANNAASATFGAVGTDADVVLAFDAVTAQGSITYMEDEDRFDFDNDVDVIGDLTAATVGSDGNITLAGTLVGITTALTGTVNNALVMSVPDQGADTNAGVGITINADDGGSGTTGGAGGGIQITAGDAKGSGDNAGGILRLDGGAKTGAGGVAGYVSIGTGSPGHVPDEDSLFVAGVLEVDGSTYLDAGATVNGNHLNVLGGYALTFSSLAQFKLGTSQTPDALTMALPATGNSLVIMDFGDRDADFEHAQQTNPTLFIHSALAPTTDDGEFLGLSYLGLAGGTMESDRATFDMTLQSVAPFATALLTNRDGADIILQTSSPTNSGTVYGITSIGANTNSRSIDGVADSLFVDGRLEVDGNAYFDGGVFFDNQVRVLDDLNLYFGDGDDVALQYDTAQTADALLIGLSTDSRNLVIAEKADMTYNFAHAQQTNPTIFIQSANQSTTEWLSLAHDQTDGRIQTGAGNLSIGSGNDSHTLTTPNDLFVTGKFEVDGAAYFDGASNFAGNLDFVANVKLKDVNNYGGVIFNSATQTPDTTVLLTSSLSNSFILMEYADNTYDFDHAQQTDPTLFIQSTNQSATEWLSFAYSSANDRAEIEAGTGKNIHFNSSIETGAYEFTEDGGFLAAMDMSVSATPAAGTQESYTFKIDGESFLKIYSEADSAGGIQNESIKFYKPVAYLPSADQEVAEGGTITCTDTITRVSGDADGSTTGATAITDGTEDGQFCILQGTHDTETVIVTDNNNTQLQGGANFTLGIGDTLTVIWDSGYSMWCEISRVDN